MVGYVFDWVIKALNPHVCRLPRLTPNYRRKFVSAYDALAIAHSKRMKDEFYEWILQMLLVKLISECFRKSFSKSPDYTHIHDRGDRV
jgi:hypothetical protein